MVLAVVGTVLELCLGQRWHWWHIVIECLFNFSQLYWRRKLHCSSGEVIINKTGNLLQKAFGFHWNVLFPMRKPNCCTTPCVWHVLPWGVVSDPASCATGHCAEDSASQGAGSPQLHAALCEVPWYWSYRWTKPGNQAHRRERRSTNYGWGINWEISDIWIPVKCSEITDVGHFNKAVPLGLGGGGVMSNCLVSVQNLFFLC